MMKFAVLSGFDNRELMNEAGPFIMRLVHTHQKMISADLSSIDEKLAYASAKHDLTAWCITHKMHFMEIGLSPDDSPPLTLDDMPLKYALTLHPATLELHVKVRDRRIKPGDQMVFIRTDDTLVRK